MGGEGWGLGGCRGVDAKREEEGMGWVKIGEGWELGDS